MAERLLVFRNLPEESVLALTITLDDAGKVSFAPEGDHGARAMEILGAGVGSNTENRFVPPDEGEAYVRAVAEMLGESSMWTAMTTSSA
ncbi:MAG: hypothetical protein QOE92_5 [Chloroflexota bacterium]|jgi:hypothetical protein|nr:hypothetical protein [Chloroflexota bacterium]